MGAWIETVILMVRSAFFAVASFMGAWIETQASYTDAQKNKVASFMGAWIETLLSAPLPNFVILSRILYGCVD